MWQDTYVTEKLREFERERRRHRDLALAAEMRRRPKPRPFAPIARITGRRVRALGEILEAWGGVERVRAS